MLQFECFGSVYRVDRARRHCGEIELQAGMGRREDENYQQLGSKSVAEAARAQGLAHRVENNFRF